MYDVLAMATLELARVRAEEELWKCQVSVVVLASPRDSVASSASSTAVTKKYRSKATKRRQSWDEMPGIPGYQCCSPLLDQI